MKIKQVHCDNPRIIINPNTPQNLLRFKHYFMRGVEFKNARYYRHHYDFLYRDFSVKLNNITLDNMDDCYIVDDATGEIFPIYLAVPCGHCDICKVSKINSFVKRCEYESQMYNFLPWFVTLTYAHEPEEGVNVRDCQLFLKRFRINLTRAGYKDKIRYVVVAEYGKKGRPHYHGLFWNIHSFTHEQYCEVKQILRHSWNNGFCMDRLVDLKDDKAFYYTTKYLKKGCNVPEGKNPTFVLSSRGNGGIGAPFIDSIKDEVRKSLNTSFQFRNKWTGKVENVMWSQYVLNRIFPSFCRSVDRLFRNAVHDFEYYFHNYFSWNRFLGRELCNFEITLRNRLSKYMFIPVGFETYCPKHGRVDASYLDGLKSFIQSKIDNIDFEFARRIDGLRFRFLGRLFKYQSSYDLVARKRRCSDILSCESPRTNYIY